MTKKISLYIFVVFSINAFSQNDTVHIYYDIGAYKLNTENQTMIQSKLERLIDSVSYQVKIISSCDFLGSNKSNLTLSLNRAIKVKNLLKKKKNIAITSITYKGIGELSTINKNSDGVQTHRKTTIIFKDETQVILEKLVDGKKGDVFVLRDIIFEPARHFLRKKSLETLKRLLKIMADHPQIEIQLNGHVCCGRNKKDSVDGYDKDSKTYDLSVHRARHIYNYLILKKIDSTRLSYKGYGFLQPLYYPEENAFQKKMNRRVEIRIVKN